MKSAGGAGTDDFWRFAGCGDIAQMMMPLRLSAIWAVMDYPYRLVFGNPTVKRVGRRDALGIALPSKGC